MEFGIHFFPTTGPAEASGAQFWDNALQLVDMVEDVGFTSVRTVEHYFDRYGGYSPSPLAFLAAAAMRTKTARLITGAVLPAFTHPAKLASEICFVDAISKGRLEMGFARAFLPLEFERFGVSLDESRSRFDEAMEVIRLLLSKEKVSHEGKHWRFPETTVYPRPTQTPIPFWIAAVQSQQSFEYAGRHGYGVMAIPMAGAVIRPLLDAYRKAWREAGHPGNGRVMLAFHMYCAPTMAQARADSEAPLNDYLRAFANAARVWKTGTTSKDYPGYDKMIDHIDKATWDSQVSNGSAWIGTPDDVVRNMRAYHELCGGFDIASMQVTFGQLPVEKAKSSLRLFAKEVMPHAPR